MRKIYFKRMNIFIFSNLLTIHFCLISMEATKKDFHEIPSYQCYKRMPIDSESIGELALQYPLPQEELTIVKEWRDQHKGLLVGLLDFTYKNSELYLMQEEHIAMLKRAGIENKSRWSYIFNIPNDDTLWVQITGPLHRVCNTKAHHKLYEKQLEPQALDSLQKPPKTFQTISRFAHYLKFLEVAESNQFNHFSVPATYLLPLDDEQSTTDYSDDTSFVIQKSLEGNPVPLRHNKDRIDSITHQSFNELLHAIKDVGLWDTQANLLIDDNNNLCMSDLEQPNHEDPSNFFNKDTLYYSHKTVCGLHQLYELCENHNELRRTIQDFARDKVDLPHSGKQKELEILLKLCE